MTNSLLIIALIFTVLGLQLQIAYSSPIANQSEAEQNQTEILCAELAKLNEMLPPDTEVLPETAGNSVSQRECGFDPNVDPEALAEAQKELNQSTRMAKLLIYSVLLPLFAIVPMKRKDLRMTQGSGYWIRLILPLV